MIVAAIALWALVAEATFSLALPLPIASPFGVICHGASSDAPIRKAPYDHQHRHQCCAAVSCEMAPPPREASPLVENARDVETFAWRVFDVILKTGPPNAFYSARGPPAV
ncbi:hypothetical protein [Methylocella sp.]|uniref:hypothetical protein n=1 Tax=Methylocella sp. TaxID=1978226 RepID=UPI0035B0DD9F